MSPGSLCPPSCVLSVLWLGGAILLLEALDGGVPDDPNSLKDAVERFREARQVLSGRCLEDPTLLARSRQQLEAASEHVTCDEKECTYSAGSEYQLQILTHCVQELFKVEARPSWVW